MTKYPTELSQLSNEYSSLVEKNETETDQRIINKNILRMDIIQERLTEIAKQAKAKFKS